MNETELHKVVQNRKIVQFQASPDLVFALAQDGTMWALYWRDRSNKWINLPSLPQDNETHIE